MNELQEVNVEWERFCAREAAFDEAIQAFEEKAFDLDIPQSKIDLIKQYMESNR